ncbi:MAG: response regulator [Planctomycetes bacterium]|nr:response regulator [Planctomycetota bacterium]
MEAGKILAVDDNPLDLKTITLILQNKDYQVLQASTSTEAKSLLDQHSDIELILLDLEMPEDISGFELCQIIKDNEKTAHIPVIFLTGTADPETITHCFKVGATDYIDKSKKLAHLAPRVSLRIKSYRDYCSFIQAKEIVQKMSSDIKGNIERRCLKLKEELQETREHQEQLIANVTQLCQKSISKLKQIELTAQSIEAKGNLDLAQKSNDILTYTQQAQHQLSETKEFFNPLINLDCQKNKSEAKGFSNHNSSEIPTQHRILVVDDDPVCIEALKLIIADYGTIDTYNNPKKALEAYKKAFELNGEKYELIISDQIMPDMTGNELIQSIREFEKQKEVLDEQKIKAMMVTQIDEFSQIIESINAGVDIYLSKPYDAKAIRESLDKQVF